MYFAVKDDFGEKPAFVAALIYLFAPIRFIEMHFRVSVGTDAVFIFVPLAFLFAKKALKGQPVFIALNAVNILLLLLSHSSTALIVIPLSLIYAFLKRRNIGELRYVLLSFILGLGISAWYLFPALFEIKYTWYYAGILNAVYVIPSALDTIYSYTFLGFLYQGHHGETRPVIGYSTMLIIIMDIYYLLKRKFINTEHLINIFFLAAFFACYFLMLPISKALWENIFLLRSFILYWRVLTPLAFISGYLGAIVARRFNNKMVILFCLFTIFSTILNWGNRDMAAFDPNSYFNERVLYTEYFEPGNPTLMARFKAREGIAGTLVMQKPQSHLEILTGSGNVEETYRNPIDHRYKVQADTDLLLSENTYYFPGWSIYVNDMKVPVDIENPLRFGTNVFNLKKGSYEIQLKFEDTPIRSLGKIVSLLSLGLLGVYMIAKKPDSMFLR